MSDARPLYVQTPAALQDACARLAGAPRFYIDTEFETGGAQRGLCLVQISRGDGDVFLIDPYKLPNLAPLADLLRPPGVEWVLHAGNQDVDWLRRTLKVELSPRLFDVQVGWGLMGPEYPVSLAYLLYRILGLRSVKAEQAGPWTNRPLTPAQLEYAAADVSHLPELREWLGTRLGESKSALLHEISSETIVPEVLPVTLEDFRNAWQLDVAGQAALKFLIRWWNELSYDEKAEAPQPRNFLSIAKMLPETGAELGQVRGMPWSWIKRHGDAFAGKLVKESAAATREGFVPLEPPPYNTFERVLAEGWLRNVAAELSAELTIAPELAFPDRILRKMIEKVEDKKAKSAAAEALTGWRATFLREPFLARCKAKS